MQISKEQGRSFALSTTGEVYELCGGRKFYFVDAAPLSFSFEILHLAVGTSGRMNAENRGPIWDAFRGGRGYGDGDLE